MERIMTEWLGHTREEWLWRKLYDSRARPQRLIDVYLLPEQNFWWAGARVVVLAPASMIVVLVYKKGEAFAHSVCYVHSSL